MAACDEIVSLPITLTVTPLANGLLPPGRPVPVLAEIDFRHDVALQSVRLYVSGVHHDTIQIESQWGASLRRELYIPLPLQPLAGPLHVVLGARIGDAQVRSDTLTVLVGDETPPDARIALPPEGVTPGVPFILGVSASDSSGVTGLSVTFSGAWANDLILDPGGRLAFHEPVTVVVPPGPAAGQTLNVAIVARDISGNADIVTAGILLVDDAAPTAALEMLEYRGVMGWVVSGVGTIAPRFYTYLAGDTLRLLLRAADGVGLSHAFVYDRLYGRRDSIGLTGLASDTVLRYPSVPGVSIRDWFAVQVLDRAGNARWDSVPAGAYAARLPPMETIAAAVLYPTFLPDGTRFIDASGAVDVFALAPLRLERTIADIGGGSVTSGDVTPSGDSLVVTGGLGGRVYVGPLDGTADDFEMFQVLPATEWTRFVAVGRNGLVGLTARQAGFAVVSRLSMSLNTLQTAALDSGGDDDRVTRPHNRALVLFGSGLVLGSDTWTSTSSLPSGDISFDSAATRVLVGDVLFDVAWNATDLLPGMQAPITALAPDGMRAWLAEAHSPEVLVVRTGDGAILDRLLLPFMPTRFTLSPNGETLIVGGGGATLAAVDVR